MSSRLTMSLLITAKHIFPNEEINPRNLLNQYGKKMVLKMVAFLNSMLQKNVDEVPQQMALWFGVPNTKGDEAMKAIFYGYQDQIRNKTKMHMVNAYANLRLNIFALELNEIDNDAEIDSDQAHWDFFKAYLKINADYTLIQENITNTLPENITGLEKANWMAAATLISYFDFAYVTKTDMLCQLIKSYYCFQFMELYNPALFEIYLASKNVRSFVEYAGHIMGLASLCFTDVVSFDGRTALDQQFLKLFSHFEPIAATEENIVGNDFLEIRNKPLFQLGENEYLFLNRAMIVNKIYSSTYWDCKSILAEHPEFNISQGKFRKDYTSEFSEGFLVYKLMEKAYGNKNYKRFSGEQMKDVMGNTEPDYYIRNGNKVFIFEVKDSFITGISKQSFNVETISEDIRSKYHSDGNHEKAVKQLITRLRFSLKKEYPFDTNYNTRNLKLFPILVVYDLNLSVPGIESLLQRWFDKEKANLVSEMAELGITGFKIHNLVILTVDDLILLTEYINHNRLSLEDLILQYQKKKANLLKITDGRSFEYIKTNVLQSYLSFHDFIRDTVNKIPPHRKLMPSEIKDILNAFQLFELENNVD
jgi:hypothetical protein